MSRYTPEEQLRADTWNLAYQAINWHRAWQNVGELAEVLFLTAQDPPSVVVEVGAAWGGTLYAWRNLPGPVQPDVYGVTLNHYADLGTGVHGATVIQGDSHDPATLRRVKDQLGGRPADVVFVDGDHSYDGTIADWRMYSPLLRPGGRFLLHDIRCAGEEAVGEAWEQIVAEATASGAQVNEIVAKAGKPLGFGIVRMGAKHDTQ